MKYLLTTLLLSTMSFGLSAASDSQTSGTVLRKTGLFMQGDRSLKRPQKAQTMAAVLAEFGEPNNKVPAIGDPPITRWEYEKFNVFFEYDKVIHSVLLR